MIVLGHELYHVLEQTFWRPLRWLSKTGDLGLGGVASTVSYILRNRARLDLDVCCITLGLVNFEVFLPFSRRVAQLALHMPVINERSTYRAM